MEATNRKANFSTPTTTKGDNSGAETESGGGGPETRNRRSIRFKSLLFEGNSSSAAESQNTGAGGGHGAIKNLDFTAKNVHQRGGEKLHQQKQTTPIVMIPRVRGGRGTSNNNASMVVEVASEITDNESKEAQNATKTKDDDTLTVSAEAETASTTVVDVGDKTPQGRPSRRAKNAAIKRMAGVKVADEAPPLQPTRARPSSQRLASWAGMKPGKHETESTTEEASSVHSSSDTHSQPSATTQSISASSSTKTPKVVAHPYQSAELEASPEEPDETEEFIIVPHKYEAEEAEDSSNPAPAISPTPPATVPPPTRRSIPICLEKPNHLLYPLSQFSNVSSMGAAKKLIPEEALSAASTSNLPQIKKEEAWKRRDEHIEESIENIVNSAVSGILKAPEPTRQKLSTVSPVKTVFVPKIVKPVFVAGGLQDYEPASPVFMNPQSPLVPGAIFNSTPSRRAEFERQLFRRSPIEIPVGFTGPLKPPKRKFTTAVKQEILDTMPIEEMVGPCATKVEVVHRVHDLIKSERVDPNVSVRSLLLQAGVGSDYESAYSRRPSHQVMLRRNKKTAKQQQRTTIDAGQNPLYLSSDPMGQNQQHFAAFSQQPQDLYYPQHQQLHPQNSTSSTTEALFQKASSLVKREVLSNPSSPGAGDNGTAIQHIQYIQQPTTSQQYQVQPQQQQIILFGSNGSNQLVSGVNGSAPIILQYPSHSQAGLQEPQQVAYIGGAQPQPQYQVVSLANGTQVLAQLPPVVSSSSSAVASGVGVQQQQPQIIYLDSPQAATPLQQTPQKVYSSNSNGIKSEDLYLIHGNSFPCPFRGCPRLFPTESGMRKHAVVHGPRFQKQYICQVCQKSFFEKGKLQRHLKSHEEQRPFVCPYQSCGKRFVLSHHRKLHINAIHKQLREFQCEDCGKEFTQAGNLRAHQLAMHQSTNKNSNHHLNSIQQPSSSSSIPQIGEEDDNDIDVGDDDDDYLSSTVSGGEEEQPPPPPQQQSVIVIGGGGSGSGGGGSGGLTTTTVGGSYRRLL